MWLVLLTFQVAKLLLAQGENACMGHSTFRSPVPSDIEVHCGSQTVDLEIFLCPIYFNGYNESLLALNSEHSKHQCKGTTDWMADPPVVKFNFSITEGAISACSNLLTNQQWLMSLTPQQTLTSSSPMMPLMVTQESGIGQFEDFSSVEYVTISGMVCSEDPSTGAITYHQEVMYRFSCRYPLQYLVNNTQMSVSGVSLAVRDNNGSFISTLSMRLYSDNNYSSAMHIPAGGLELKTRIFVEVKASNLTNRFNVLLDRCYATASPFPINTTFHDLFVGCNRDGQTVMGINGQQQKARFSFEAFRFVQFTGSALSTYYVHCATRLCVNSFCPTLTQNCTTDTNSKRRRSIDDNQDTTVSDMATISSGPITTRQDNGFQKTQMNSSVVAVSIVAGIVGSICLTLVAFIVHYMYKSKISIKTTLS